MSEQPDPGERQPITIQRVLDVLNQGQIEAEHGLMRWSTNYTFLVTVCHDDTQLTAVYKPHKGERPLWDFPDGMLCKRELASFLTSEELGWRIVPPTVVRDGPRGIGSVQFFIEHDPEENYFTFGESHPDEMRRICAFDVLVNNADRKGGHLLIDQQGHIWGIDHGITFNQINKLRTVIWDFAGEPLPDALLSDIDRLRQSLIDHKSAFHQSLTDLLTEREIMTFQQRVQQMLRARKFPRPGPGGPNYPWPPV